MPSAFGWCCGIGTVPATVTCRQPWADCMGTRQQQRCDGMNMAYTSRQSPKPTGLQGPPSLPVANRMGPFAPTVPMPLLTAWQDTGTCTRQPGRPTVALSGVSSAGVCAATISQTQQLPATGPQQCLGVCCKRWRPCNTHHHRVQGARSNIHPAPRLGGAICDDHAAQKTRRAAAAAAAAPASDQPR